MAPAALSGAGAYLGTRPKGIGITVLLTMVGSFGASVFCPALTWVALVATGGETGLGHMGLGDSIAGLLMLITIFGAFIAVPLGLLFGVVYSVGLGTLKWLQQRVPSRSNIDLAVLTLGLGLVLVSAVCVVFIASTEMNHPLAGPYAAPLQPAFDRTWTPILTTGLGLLATLFGAARIVGRSVFISRVERGLQDGWAVVPPSGIDDAGSLPRLLPFGRTGRVLVRSAVADSGPFRSGDTSTPIARV